MEAEKVVVIGAADWANLHHPMDRPFVDATFFYALVLVARLGNVYDALDLEPFGKVEFV